MNPIPVRGLNGTGESHEEAVTLHEQVAILKRDLREQYRVNSILHEASSQAGNILQSIDDAIAAISRNWRLTYLNQRMMEISGRKVGRVRGRTIWEVFPWCEEDAAKHNLARAMEERIPVRFDTLLAGERWFETCVYPSPTGVTLLLRDITERIRDREALNASEDRYRSLLETAYEGVWTVNAESKTTFVNQRMAEMLGYSLAELEARAFLDFFFEEDCDEALKNFDRRKRGIQGAFECRLKRRDGSELWAIVSATPIYDTDGTFSGVLRMFTDITDKKQRQEKLIEETHRLQRALLNSISHNLRTPLASITGALSSFIEDYSALDERARRELLENAREQAECLNRLVGNLLDMSRLEAGAMRLKREPCDVQDVVGAALAQLGDRARERTIQVKVPPEVPLVEMDFVLVAQVLVNLLDNALRYSPPDSPVFVESWTEDDRVGIRVADLGVGIPTGDLERVFDKFNWGEHPGVKSGTGLGLSICRGLIEAHGGQIWAGHNDPRGSVLTFVLPKVRPDAFEEGGHERGTITSFDRR